MFCYIRHSYDLILSKFTDVLLHVYIYCRYAPISVPINRSIRRLYSASLAELFIYNIVTQFNRVSYIGWIVKKEESEDTNFVKILQLT